jgi:hypothetical protein
MQPDKLFIYLRFVSAFGLFAMIQKPKMVKHQRLNLLNNRTKSHVIELARTSFQYRISPASIVSAFIIKVTNGNIEPSRYFLSIILNTRTASNLSKHFRLYSKSNQKEVVEGINIEKNWKVLDLGGADGTLVIRLAQKYLNESFGKFDRPEVRDIAQMNIDKFNLIKG